MTQVMDVWETTVANMTYDGDDLPLDGPLPLNRVISDGLGSLAGPEMEMDQLDAVLDALDGELSAAYSDSSDEGDHPTVVSYSSSDESVGVSSKQSACSLETDCCNSQDQPKRKRAPSTKRTPANLSAQEKRELRKLRNRELAAESRKRKNDEMDRLRHENTLLKQRIAELEKQLAEKNPSSIVPSSSVKRSRVGTAIGTSVAVTSMAAFVVMGPSDIHNPGVSATASVLVTALDSCDGSLQTLAQILFTFAVGMVIMALAGRFLSGAVHNTAQSLKSLRSSGRSAGTVSTARATTTTSLLCRSV